MTVDVLYFKILFLQFQTSKYRIYITMKQETRAQQPQLPTNVVPPQNQKIKKTAEDYKQEALENKKRWMPFVRFLKKNGLKLKAARCSQVRVEYFRLKDIRKVIEDKKADIQRNATLKQLASCWQKQVMYFERPDNLPHFKYPKQLQKSQNISEAKFASFKFDSAEQKTWLFPLILFGIIAVVLFPLWPYMLKYAVFMICLVLVTAILSIIVFRLVVYLFFAMFGTSLWVLPNFFADCSLMESFMPVYESKKWESGVFSIVGRILALTIFAYYGYQVYIDSSWIYENIEITKTSFDDLHDWGVSKIKGEKNFSQSALTNLEHIMNQTAEIHIDESVDLENSYETTEQIDEPVYEQQIEQEEGQEEKEQYENEAQIAEEKSGAQTTDEQTGTQAVNEQTGENKAETAQL